MTGLVLDEAEPAGRFLKKELLRYLAGQNYAPAPEWSAILKKRLAMPPRSQRKTVAVDAGGRPADWWNLRDESLFRQYSLNHKEIFQ